jgi:hypothetical protein
MLAAYDVIDLMSEIGVVRMEQTVFALVARAVCDKLS